MRKREAGSDRTNNHDPDEQDGQSWIARFIQPSSATLRRKVSAEIQEGSSPGFDFFLLVGLSSAIATLGLLQNAPAVIIGAMLVAPLMSPILGVGLGSISGDTRLARNGVSALLRGALFSILIAIFITLLSRVLPFGSFQVSILPHEVLVRTQPSPVDLVIALAGGVATAYALTHPNLSAALTGVAVATSLMPPLCVVGIGLALRRWDIAGGATLLFLTNAVTIAFSATTVFFLLGFGPHRQKEDVKIPRPLWISALLTGFLLTLLVFVSIRSINRSTQIRQINETVKNEIGKLAFVQLDGISINDLEGVTNIDVSIQTERLLTHAQGKMLQESLVESLNLPISLKINQVLTNRLDPMIPPTPTATATLGPSPTITLTPTVTLTPVPSKTYTPTSPPPTQTPIPSSTPLPGQARVVGSQWGYLIYMYQRPNGPSIAQLRVGQVLTTLYGRTTEGGLVWIEVMDQDGRLGWVPQVNLVQINLASPTATPSKQP